MGGTFLIWSNKVFFKTDSNKTFLFFNSKIKTTLLYFRYNFLFIIIIALFFVLKVSLYVSILSNYELWLNCICECRFGTLQKPNLRNLKPLCFNCITMSYLCNEQLTDALQDVASVIGGLQSVIAC